MIKWIWTILILSMSLIGCTGVDTQQQQHGETEPLWRLPRVDLHSLPQATHKSLTQVYSDYSLVNRDVTFRDERLLTMRGIDKVYTMPEYKTRKEWEARKEYLRAHVLICAGLWPMPRKTPLHPAYYHKIVHDDYIVETVTIQPYPGFFLGGNIYRPKGTGPFPGVLCPHGHFKHGRLTDNMVSSIPGRCINFAKQGYVAFSYDMVGYCDTRQASHTFADDRISSLYGINLLGLQLWNSIRALDFLLSLPEVDTNRIGITGASGGGTQTFLLTAVDDRFQAAAPVNMVSNTMQGGDLCENAPGLRVNTFNVEIAAMVAPKPLLLVSDTHDWTFNTRNTIMPMMRSIYRLYDAADKVKNEHFDYKHNYNKASREAVYAWFGKWLLGKDKKVDLREHSFVTDPDSLLLAFLNKPLGAAIKDKKSFEQLSPSQYHDAPLKLDEEGLKQLLKKIYRQQLQRNWPKNEHSLKKFRKVYGTAVQHLIGTGMPQKEVTCKIIDRSKGSDFIATQLLISEKQENKWIPCVLYQPMSATGATVILTADEGKGQWVSKGSAVPDKRIKTLLNNGFNVLTPDLFKQGEHVLQDSTLTRRDEHTKFFTTYNLTDRQNQIQDLITIIKALKENKDLSGSINLYATGNTGMTGLLLAATTKDLDHIVIDGDHFDPTADKDRLQLQIPGIMRIGGIKTVLALASNQRLLIYNANPDLKEERLNKVSELENNKDRFSIFSKPLPFNKIVAFMKP